MGVLNRERRNNFQSRITPIYINVRMGYIISFNKMYEVIISEYKISLPSQ